MTKATEWNLPEWFRLALLTVNSAAIDYIVDSGKELQSILIMQVKARFLATPQAICYSINN